MEFEVKVQKIEVGDEPKFVCTIVELTEEKYLQLLSRFSSVDGIKGKLVVDD